MWSIHLHLIYIFFFFNDTATTEIYTLSLHDALPISGHLGGDPGPAGPHEPPQLRPQVQGDHRHDAARLAAGPADRKSTRLNSSHANISYAVFCLKKKKNSITDTREKTQNSRTHRNNQ